MICSEFLKESWTFHLLLKTFIAIWIFVPFFLEELWNIIKHQNGNIHETIKLSVRVKNNSTSVLNSHFILFTSWKISPHSFSFQRTSQISAISIAHKNGKSSGKIIERNIFENARCQLANTLLHCSLLYFHGNDLIENVALLVVGFISAD